MWKTIFKVLDKNTYVKDEDISKINSYLFLRWLGNNQYTVLAANKLNQYSKIPMINQYNMVRDAFGGKRLYIKYPKSTSDADKYREAIAWHFRINPNLSAEYQQFIPEQELEDILSLYNEAKEYA